MIPATDFDAAWRYFQFVRKVTVRLYDPATDTVSATSLGPVDAFPAGGATNSLAPVDEGDVLGVSRVWHVRAKHLPGVVLGPRSWIVDADGTRWVILSAQCQTNNTRWRCECEQVKGA